MYAESIVSERLGIARETLGYHLEYHSPAEIDDFERRLEQRYADSYAQARAAAQGTEDSTKAFQIAISRLLADPANPRLTRDEVRFIENERALIQCDAAYFLTRYYWILDRENMKKRFTFQAGQRILFDVISEMEQLRIAIEIILAKARQLGMCLHPTTRVLTADLRWVPIDDLKVGDKLIAVDESTPGKRGHRCMREAVIEGKQDSYDHGIRVELDNGESFIATPRHPFLCKKRGGVDTQWRKTGEFKVGDEIRYVTTTWGEPNYEDGWFGGLIDGEGSLRGKTRAGVEMCVSQVEGAVLDRARNYLKREGYTFREEWDHRKGGESSKFGSKPVCKFVLGRANEIFKLIGKTRPSRMLDKGNTWWQGKGLPGKKTGIGWAKITSIQLLPRQRMIDLQTSEKTFIAEGFVSHNTTLVGGLELLKVMMSEGVGGIVASADRGKTKEMVSKIFFAYDKLPWWLRPLTSKRVESDQGMIAFAGMDSKIIFQHGKQTNPIAMGSTPVTYHLSEVSAYADAEELIEVGLFKCVHPSTRVFGVLESTCKGDTGWWYDTYWHSKNMWKRGQSRLMALFLPFYCGTDMYPNETWLRKSPVPQNWRPDVETRKMVAESEIYVHTMPLLEKVLCQQQGQTIGQWKLPTQQAWYWEQNYREHRDKGADKTWLQEMPHTDTAAFQGSYDNVFGREIIAEVWTQRQTAYNVYAIVGQSIEERHEPNPEDLDLSEKVIPIAYHSLKGETYRWELWPLQWVEPFDEVQEIRDDESHMGKLFVWHPPEPGYDYAVGIDTSNGIGSDSTCIAVARRGRSPQEQDVQAAEFRSNQVSHVEAFAWGMAIAAYYARYMEDSTRHREPYVAIEQIAAVGDTCNLQMRKMGYNRFHRMTRYDSTPKNMMKSKATKVGWFTNAWSRPMLTDGFVTLVRNGWYKVNSPYTMREMTQWEVHYTASGKDKFEHAEEGTDDGIFANAMAGFCPNDTQVMASRSKKQFTGEVGSKLPPLDLTVRGGIVVNADQQGFMSRDDILERLRGW